MVLALALIVGIPLLVLAALAVIATMRSSQISSKMEGWDALLAEHRTTADGQQTNTHRTV